jgi:hypothetical protein
MLPACSDPGDRGDPSASLAERIRAIPRRALVLRSPEHNRAVGSAKRSKHMEGTAFDIATSNREIGVDRAMVPVRRPEAAGVSAPAVKRRRSVPERLRTAHVGE